VKWPYSYFGQHVDAQTGALWAVVNERDELGPNLVPDYLTSVKPAKPRELKA
jgi:glucose/arabinose dehydrogenase